jgi:hypothetical protein
VRKYFVLAVCILMFAATAVHAEFYRWVDRDGKEFFSNDPKKVPQEYRDSMTKIEPDESRVSVAGKPAGAGKAAAPSGEHRDKHGRGEEYWRKRAANLRLKLRDQQDDYSLVMKQLEDQGRSPAMETDSKKKKMRGNLEKKKTKIEKDMARLKRVLEVDLPEEARRADAYPGWLRE